ncbi:thiamine-phosphate diphosphorylase [Methanobrevibacter arboriphilus JCM 13429 = DSM 1125]|uniref:Thiamine-phosphate synthase n=1 Tax=Methanobrevibacter arboriphilus JCM 13429 = DSM 1125 TaxID=1300164 RepID=A0A1V6N0D5_METAZ|nr:thiamine phosphate synthase [Methanobrevibacter arboriphilus]OQD58148.1 thiamine-phosphate diphosphorylase [Methanobrevibacter arboriphilus JCM 13429 = DSM 1125]
MDKLEYANKPNYSLYLVTDRNNKKDEEFLKIVEEGILGGVTIVQLREKDTPTGKFYDIALKLKNLTSRYNIPLIINDRIDIALAIDADGVHIGQSDMPANIARKLVGEDKILGVSAATISDALTAEKYGADYIGSGAIFPTDTKEAECIDINYLKEIINKVNIPVVAIGGLNENNINSLKETNIKGISVVSAIMNSIDPKKSATILKKEYDYL